MQSSNVQVLGVHPIVSTPELERGAFDIKFGALCLSDMEKRDALQHIRSELGSVYLVEVKVDASDGVVDIGRFHQPGSDQF